MQSLNAKEQANLARLLQSNDRDELQAGLFSLRQTDTSKITTEFLFQCQLPVLFGAMPQIAACLLRQALNTDAAYSRRMECLQGLMRLVLCAPKAIGQSFDKSQIHSCICVMAEATTWPSHGMHVNTLMALLTSYLEAICSLLESSSYNLDAADMFFTLLLASDQDDPRHHDATVRVALAVLQHFSTALADPSGKQDLQEVADAMFTLASWDLPHHIAGQLRSLSATAAVAAAAERSCTGRNMSLNRVCCCVCLLIDMFMAAVILPDVLPGKQLHTLVLAQRALRQLTSSCSSWDVLEPHMHMKLWAGCSSPIDQATHLLQHSWMPFSFFKLDAQCLGPITAGRSNAEVLVHALSGYFDLVQYDQFVAPHPTQSPINPSCVAASTWWQVLTWVQLGIPHPLASPEGVRLLLKAGLLKGIKHLLALFLSKLTAPVALSEQTIVDSLLAITAWYAERFPAVCSGIAAEHLAASKARVNAKSVERAAITGGSSMRTRTAASASPPSTSNNTASSDSSSLWAVLQELQGRVVQTAAAGSAAAGCNGEATGGLAADSAEPGDYSRMCDDEFGALPMAQVLHVLHTPRLSASLCKLQRLVTGQIEVSQLMPS